MERESTSRKEGKRNVEKNEALDVIKCEEPGSVLYFLFQAGVINEKYEGLMSINKSEFSLSALSQTSPNCSTSLSTFPYEQQQQQEQPVLSHSPSLSQDLNDKAVMP